MNLPTCKYHPDPIATESIKPSETHCECCGQQRGYVYVGPVFSVEELSECICPWCIADGSAHAKFDAEFTDAAGVGGYSKTPVVPDAVIEEVAFRTPGFSGWQRSTGLLVVVIRQPLLVERAAQSLSAGGLMQCLRSSTSAAWLMGPTGRITSARSTKMAARLHTFSSACTVAGILATQSAIDYDRVA